LRSAEFYSESMKRKSLHCIIACVRKMS